MKKNDCIEESERKTQDEGVVADYDGEASNRAKLVEAMGDDFVESKSEVVGIDGKMSNFWYHYKWHVIFGACILLFIAVGISQLMNNNPNDVTALYVGPASIDENGVTSALSEMLTTDENNNGKKRAAVIGIELYSASQVDELVAKKKAEGASYPYYDQGANDEAYRDYQSYLYLGEFGVMFLDPTLYSELKEAGALARLDEVFDSVPSEALDEYGIRLYDTEFCNYYSAFKSMPEDTVLCLRAVGGTDKTSVKNYERNKSLLIDIMSFDYPEGYVGEKSESVTE